MKKIILLVLVGLIGFYVAWPAYSGYGIHAALQAGDRDTLANRIDFPSVRQSMRTPVLAKVDERMTGFMKTMGPAASALGVKQVPKQKIEAVVDGTLAEIVEPNRLIAIYGKGGDYAGAMQEAVVKQIDKLGGVGAFLGMPKGQPAQQSAQQPAEQPAGGGFGGFGLPGGLGDVAGKVGDLIGGAKNVPGLENIPGAGDLVGKLGLDTGKIAQMLFPKGSAAQTGGGSSSFGLGNIKSFSFNGPLAMQVGIARTASAPGPDVTAEMAFQDFGWKVTKITPHL